MPVNNVPGNPLAKMLEKAFTKFDKDADGKLSADEFASFNEILKPGIAVDETGKPTVDYSECMDQNSDGGISRSEMESTSVLMPATMTSSTFSGMINYLNLRGDPLALEAAQTLLDDDSGEL